MSAIDAARDEYITLRIRERLTPSEARQTCHIHYREASILEREVQDWVLGRQKMGNPVHLIDDLVGDDEPLPYDHLSNDALRALEDFAFFRIRYFGRQATPWQTQAAETLAPLLETPLKEYTVVNCPPGSGKSTLFAHDIPVWLAVRNRALRCLIGSYTERQAVQYIGRIRRTLGRKTPMPDAASTLIKDFGGFRPLQRDLWRVNEFIIAQPGEFDYSEKEPSFAAFGYDSAFLGGRYDLIVWDDLVDRHSLRTTRSIEDMEKWWGDEAESRLEPGGLLILQGQRMAAHDLYRHALGLQFEDGRPKYTHIVFPAHAEDLCEGHHDPTGAPWPDGCLLDPVRVSWRDMAAVRRQSLGRWRTLFQQEDIDADLVLVQQIWLDGGEDGDGNQYPGCWDKHRKLGELPPGFEAYTAVVTVDPSASNKWGIIFWLVDPVTEYRYAIDIHNSPLQVSDFLDFNAHTGEFSGLLERWYRKYSQKGAPLRFVVIEVNAAQKWLLQWRFAQQWAATRGIQLISHTTTIKRNDPEFGVQSLRPLFKFGKVRLPGKGDYQTIQDYVLQLLTWPDTKYDDLVMATYFLEAQWANVAVRYNQTPALWRPSWLRNERRGLVGTRGTRI